MSQSVDKTKWTLEKTERFKRLVLRHVSNGGSVTDACEQFEYETQGLHKKYANRLKWIFLFRFQCKQEYYRARAIGSKVKMLQLDGQEEMAVDKVNANNNTNISEDDLSFKVVSAIQELLEDRQHVMNLSQNYREQFELAEKVIEELQEERKLSELRVGKKEKEIEKLQQLARDKQFKIDQLGTDYDKLRASTVKESDKLHLQLKAEQLKYDQVNNEMIQLRSNSSKEVERLESHIKLKQLEYDQLAANYNRLSADNEKLTKSITEFTRQLTNFLPTESTSATHESTEVSNSNLVEIHR
ncbi:MAG: hypothetical protein JWN30_1449 [Bacilli bacterium]|nr:hypothetical protein [Bacilli bacterium]